MRAIVAFAQRLAKDETGTSSIEYSVLALVIAVAMMASMQGLGSILKQTWDHVANETDKVM